MIGNTAQIDSPRFIGGQSAQPQPVLPGRIMLGSGKEVASQASDVTVSSATIIAKVKIEAKQVTVCYLDPPGILPGEIASLTREDFLVGFSLKQARRNCAAAQSEWHAHHSARNAEPSRAPRIVPLYRSNEVHLGERIVLDGTILDISMSGGATSPNGAEVPFVGARVRVGKRFATVVRLIDTGIAVQFADPFTPDNFDEGVRL